jgi:hypothetical protein
VADRHAPAAISPQALGLTEAIWGAVLLSSTGSLLPRVARESLDPRVIPVARVLGARHLAQGLVIALRPNHLTLQVGAAVDALHSATMVTAAAANLGPRRLTMASALMAGAFSAAATQVGQAVLPDWATS